MTILHTCECTSYSPYHKAHEVYTKHITRNRRLTTKGCERILRKELNRDLTVTRVETAIYQSR